MKKIHLLLASWLGIAAAAHAQEKVISLPAPDMGREGTVMQALQDRKSTRQFSPEALSIQDLGDLLWAACGINREDGRRTSGTARNKQDCDVYVIMETGAYLYRPKTHSLSLVKELDLRKEVAGMQAFVLDAPVSLVIVSDFKKMGKTDNPHTMSMCSVDAGIVSQNISVFCASAGMATVARATMNTEILCRQLGLSEDQHPILNHPVGYMR